MPLRLDDRDFGFVSSDERGWRCVVDDEVVRDDWVIDVDVDVNGWV